MEPIYQTHAQGKLLLTAEYAVLDGALALALPVRYGQTLTAMRSDVLGLHWTAQEADAPAWFTAQFSLPDLALLNSTDIGSGETLHAIFQAIRAQRPDFLTIEQRLCVHTRTDFPRSWGLGTSSTLIAALSRWAEIDPYAVLEVTLGGSGYDLACAYAKGPLVYKRRVGQAPLVKQIDFHPTFTSQLHFVFLGQKQNSREGIRLYRQADIDKQYLVQALSELTHQILAAPTLTAFQQALMLHERTLSEALQLPTVQTRLFADFSGVVKSLGAWGGDFVLAASEQSATIVHQYFAQKGYKTVLAWDDMVGFRL